MEKHVLSQFKNLFEEEKRKILSQQNPIQEGLVIPSDDLADEADLCASEMLQNMKIKMNRRNSHFLKKVENALKRIQNGTFGQCTSCEEEIEIKRLQVRPTADLCISCKEDEERNEQIFAQKRTSLSGTNARVRARLRIA